MDKKLKFLQVASSYLFTSKILLEMMSFSNNNCIAIANIEITEEELMRQTKYSDTNLMIPALFNLYHGLELIMKGMVLAHDGNIITEHKPEKLFNDLKEIENEDAEYIFTISKYMNKPISVNFINEYVVKEKIKDISQLYQSLRYPSPIKLDVIYNYFDLSHRGKEIIPEIDEIIRDIDLIIKGTAKIYRELGN